MEMFCPTCGRKLVSYNEDGTGNLAPKAEVFTRREPGEIEATVMEAICHRRSCRFKRFIHNHGIILDMDVPPRRGGSDGREEA